MLHKFEIDKTKLVLDVHSGALHQVDDLSWHLLDHYQQKSKTQLITEYSVAYNQAEIEEALVEIEQLTAQGLLFSVDPVDEQYDMDQVFSGDVVKALCLHVAHDCNLRCKYCFAGQGPFGGDRSLMSLETGCQAIDFLLKQSDRRRHIEVDFFGGEPLLNFAVVKQLVTYSRKKAALFGKKIKFTLTTNALLLDESTAQYLLDNAISVVLSLDGRPAIHDKMRPAGRGAGSYRQVLKNIKRLVAKNPPGGYYVRGTYTRHNLDFSKDIMHMIDQGLVDISVEPVVAQPEAEYALRLEDAEILKQEYRYLVKKVLEMITAGRRINFFHFNVDLEAGPCLAKRLSGCGAGHEYLAVTPAGYLYPCHQFVGHSQFQLGHVSSNELNQNIRQQFKRAHLYNKPACRQCWAKYYCSGGCNANAYAFNGDLLQPYQLECMLTQARLECALYLKCVFEK
ncbi:MAG: thioether cross-link-forming SCIFF peptide maturase [Desulfotomaculum sp.]|nr:thioether cross-link-forming SCIFF peptide maturase [Desulfotomaculum sp.]